MAIVIGLLFIGFGIAALVVLRPKSTGEKSLKDVIDDSELLLDVRNIGEFRAGHIEHARNVPIETLPKRFGLIERWAGGKEKTVVVYCGSGMKADRAQRMLRGAGFAAVVNGGGYGRLKNVR